MKQLKFSGLLLSILTIFLLIGCGGGDNRDYYIEQLEALDRTDLRQLNGWLDDNEESLDELFEFVDIRVDLEGNELDFMEQVLGLDIDYFDSWSFEVEDDTITFTYVWDYVRANEVTDPLAADNEILASWIGEDVIPFIEDIDVEAPLMFWSSIAGFTSGTRNTLEDLNISVYFEAQIDLVLTYLEETNSFVLENADADQLDLEEARDIIIETLNAMRNIFLGE